MRCLRCFLFCLLDFPPKLLVSFFKSGLEFSHPVALCISPFLHLSLSARFLRFASFTVFARITSLAMTLLWSLPMLQHLCSSCGISGSPECGPTVSLLLFEDLHVDCFWKVFLYIVLSATNLCAMSHRILVLQPWNMSRDVCRTG